MVFCSRDLWARFLCWGSLGKWLGAEQVLKAPGALACYQEHLSEARWHHVVPAYSIWSKAKASRQGSCELQAVVIQKVGQSTQIELTPAPSGEEPKQWRSPAPPERGIPTTRGLPQLPSLLYSVSCLLSEAVLFNIQLSHRSNCYQYTSIFDFAHERGLVQRPPMPQPS